MRTDNPTAVIADDESELRTYLKSLLGEVWPQLEICAEAGNGNEVLEAIENHQPQVAFIDIRMPGISGLHVAHRISLACHVVFVTAYDEYAVVAFEEQAVDYLLKPVSMERLSKTVRRLQKLLREKQTPSPRLAELTRDLVEKIAAVPQQYLQWVRVQHGDSVKLIPVHEVIYLQACDKYTAVRTVDSEFLIRVGIRELVRQLDPNRFWQIHRGTIVNVAQIAKVSRSLTGRGVIRLRDRSETLTVSRKYLYLFKQM